MHKSSKNELDQQMCHDNLSFALIKLPPEIEYSSIIISFSGNARLSAHPFRCLLFEVNAKTTVLHILDILPGWLPSPLGKIIINITTVRIVSTIFYDFSQSLLFLNIPPASVTASSRSLILHFKFQAALFVPGSCLCFCYTLSCSRLFD